MALGWSPAGLNSETNWNSGTPSPLEKYTVRSHDRRTSVPSWRARRWASYPSMKLVCAIVSGHDADKVIESLVPPATLAQPASTPSAASSAGATPPSCSAPTTSGVEEADRRYPRSVRGGTVGAGQTPTTAGRPSSSSTPAASPLLRRAFDPRQALRRPPAMNYHLWIDRLPDERGRQRAASPARSTTTATVTSPPPKTPTGAAHQLHRAPGRRSPPWGELDASGKLKKARPDLVVGVTGCVVDGNVDGFLKQAPRSSTSTSTPPSEALLEYLAERGLMDCPDYGDLQPEKLGAGTASPERVSQAVSRYVPVIYGCNYNCTYCIVPYTRPQSSRTAAEILDQCRWLIAEGAKGSSAAGADGRRLRRRPDARRVMSSRPAPGCCRA